MRKTAAATRTGRTARKARKAHEPAVQHLTLEQYERARLKAERARKRARLKAPTRAAKTAAVRAGRRLGILSPPTPLPARFDPTDQAGNRLATAVRQQPENDPRCTAYAVAAAMEAFWCRRQQQPNAAPHLSVDDIFGRAGPEVDRAVDAASSGVADEICWPPGQTKCADPKPHSWEGKFRLMSEPLKQMPEAMCRALVDGGPLVIAFPVFANFDAFTGSGVYEPQGSAVGAHAVCVVGYERAGTGGVWIVKNSYGTAWGDGGYARFRWKDKHLNPERVVYATEDVRHPAS